MADTAESAVTPPPSTDALRPPFLVQPPDSSKTFFRHRASRAAAAAESPATWNSGAAWSTASRGRSRILLSLTLDWKCRLEWEMRAPRGPPEVVPEVKTIAAASLGANLGSKEEEDEELLLSLATMDRRAAEDTWAKEEEREREGALSSPSPSSSSQTTTGASGPRGSPKNAPSSPSSSPSSLECPPCRLAAAAAAAAASAPATASAHPLLLGAKRTRGLRLARSPASASAGSLPLRGQATAPAAAAARRASRAASAGKSGRDLGEDAAVADADADAEGDDASSPDIARLLASSASPDSSSDTRGGLARIATLSPGWRAMPVNDRSARASDDTREATACRDRARGPQVKKKHSSSSCCCSSCP